MSDPPRTVRDLRRSQIIAVARNLVAEGGLEALTIGALERRLEFTRGVITYHFRDKTEIVAAVLESAIEEIDAATFAEVRAGGSADDKIRAVVESKVRGFLDHREARLIMLAFWARLPSDPEAAALNSRLFTTWRKQASHLVRAGQTEGAFGPDVKVDAFGALIVGVVIGIVIQASFEPGAVDTAAMLDEAAASLLARLKE